MNFKYMWFEFVPSGYAVITFDNPEGKNVINIDFINEINFILSDLQDNEKCKAIVFRGRTDDFCIGMDFGKVNEDNSDLSGVIEFMKLMDRLYKFPAYIVSVIEGEATAGGVGFAAVSDYVISGRNAHFSLPEAIWGLVPAVIFPYLSLRTGFRNARKMTILFNKISADEAEKSGLVDEVSDSPDISCRRLMSRFTKIRKDTIKRQKDYFTCVNQMYSETLEYIRCVALEQIRDERTVMSIDKYTRYGKLPWENID